MKRKHLRLVGERSFGEVRLLTLPAHSGHSANQANSRARPPKRTFDRMSCNDTQVTVMRTNLLSASNSSMTAFATPRPSRFILVICPSKTAFVESSTSFLQNYSFYHRFSRAKMALLASPSGFDIRVIAIRSITTKILTECLHLLK